MWAKCESTPAAPARKKISATEANLIQPSGRLLGSLAEAQRLKTHTPRPAAGRLQTPALRIHLAQMWFLKKINSMESQAVFNIDVYMEFFKTSAFQWKANILTCKQLCFTPPWVFKLPTPIPPALLFYSFQYFKNFPQMACFTFIVKENK